MATGDRLLDLLRACGCEDALVGDLAEQYATRMNRGWLLKEVGAAITQQMLSTFVLHKRLAAESIVAGWALLYLVNLITHQFITAPLVLQVFGGTGLGPWGIAFANAPDLIIPPLCAPFLLARLHPRFSFATASAFIVTFLALHAAAVVMLSATSLLHRQPLSWANLLNVPFTFALMMSGALLGTKCLRRSVS